jgi:hypothetical protein
MVVITILALDREGPFSWTTVILATSAGIIVGVAYTVWMLRHGFRAMTNSQRKAILLPTLGAGILLAEFTPPSVLMPLFSMAAGFLLGISFHPDPDRRPAG